MERSGPYRPRRTGSRPHPYSRGEGSNVKAKSSAKSDSTQGPTSSHGSSLFSRFKNFFFGHEKAGDAQRPTAQSETVPKLMRYTEAPPSSPRKKRQVSRASDRSLTSDFGLTPDRSVRSTGRDPNLQLKEFFEENGDRELSTIEVAGVLSLIKDAVSRNESVLDFSNVSDAGENASLLNQSQGSFLSSGSTTFSGFDSLHSSYIHPSSEAHNLSASARNVYAPRRTPMGAAQQPWNSLRTNRRSLASGPRRQESPRSSLQSRVEPSSSRPRYDDSVKSVSSSIIFSSLENKDEIPETSAPTQTRFQPRRHLKPTSPSTLSSGTISTGIPLANATNSSTVSAEPVRPNLPTFAPPRASLKTSANAKTEMLSEGPTNPAKPFASTTNNDLKLPSWIGAEKAGGSTKPTEEPVATSFESVNSNMDTDGDEFELNVPEHTIQAQKLSEADRRYLESAKSDFSF